MMRSVLLAAETDGMAQHYYRAKLPAQALTRRGWRAEVTEFTMYPKTIAEIARSGPRLRGMDSSSSSAPGPLRFGRIYDPADFVTVRVADNMELGPTGYTMMRKDDLPDAIRHARSDGQRVFYDCDDDLWHLPEWSPAKKAVDERRNDIRRLHIETVEAVIQACDGLICTTEHIARTAAEMVDGCPPCHVIRNGIDVALYPERKPKDESSPLRLGWAASVEYHRPALRALAEPLREMVGSRQGKVELWHLGANRTVSEQIETELGEDFPGGITKVPWVPYAKLPSTMAVCDLAIIPRIPSPFNEGQSCTSGLAWAAAGVPFVATESAEYRRLAEQGVGWVRETPEKMCAQVGMLVDEPEMRWEFRRLARRLIHQQYGPKMIAGWYEKVFDG